MPILYKANLLCNFNCLYCYQHTIRPEDQIIDHDAVEKTIRRLWEEGGGKGEDGKLKLNEDGIYCGPKVILHGGEPTTLPRDIFEKNLKLAYELTGVSGIQTNGYLIDNEFIELFKKYKTSVCISIDGSWPLNEFRGVGTSKERKKQTLKILRNMDLLQEAGINVSVIAVIHKANATGDRKEMMMEWIKSLDRRKISGRLNICVSGNPKLDLTVKEATEFYTEMFDYMMLNAIRGWSPYRDIIASLRREREVVCIFRECDPYCTKAANSVMFDGSTGVCLKIHHDGKRYIRHSKYSSIRSKILLETDCKDCKWWEHCYGGCSGTAIDFDWRNKDRFCPVYKTLFVKLSKIGFIFNIDKQTKGRSGRAQQRSSPPKEGDYQDHYDEFEHLDGDHRYLDSDQKWLRTKGK